MARQDANYSALLANERNPFGVQMPITDDDETTEDDFRVTDTDNDEEAPRDSGLMIHVVPDTSKGE